MKVPWHTCPCRIIGTDHSFLYPLYLALGTDDAGRQAAYRELFRDALEPGLVDEIRRATNGNFVLGNESFAAQVSAPSGSGRRLGSLAARASL